jgi:hypothetical protein
MQPSVWVEDYDKAADIVLSDTQALCRLDSRTSGPLVEDSARGIRRQVGCPEGTHGRAILRNAREHLMRRYAGRESLIALAPAKKSSVEAYFNCVEAYFNRCPSCGGFTRLAHLGTL